MKVMKDLENSNYLPQETFEASKEKVKKKNEKQLVTLESVLLRNIFIS